MGSKLNSNWYTSFENYNCWRHRHILRSSISSVQRDGFSYQFRHFGYYIKKISIFICPHNWKIKSKESNVMYLCWIQIQSDATDIFVDLFESIVFFLLFFVIYFQFSSSSMRAIVFDSSDIEINIYLRFNLFIWYQGNWCFHNIDHECHTLNSYKACIYFYVRGNVKRPYFFVFDWEWKIHRLFLWSFLLVSQFPFDQSKQNQISHQI